MPKVLFVIDTLMPSGAERSLVQIAERFKEYTPVFVHLYKGDALRSELEKQNIKVYSLNFDPKAKYKDVQKKLEEIYHLEKPDIIHSTLFRSDLVTRRLRSKHKIPLISSLVNNSYNSLRFKGKSIIFQAKLRLVQLYDGITSRKVDFFISNSETIKLTNSRSLRIPLNRIKVIYRGRDIKKIEEAEANIINHKENTVLNQGPVLLNVSRLIERKGQLDIINGMPAIQESFPEAKLLIAGHGDFESTLTDRIEELNLQNSVKLLGRRNDIPELLAQCDVFVYPSYFEGLPGALIEAMLAGKIIVCSDIPENLECVTDECALIFNRGDVHDYVSKVLTALRNKNDLKHLGQNAKLIGKRKFDIEKIAFDYEVTYNDIIKK